MFLKNDCNCSKTEKKPVENEGISLYTLFAWEGETNTTLQTDNMQMRCFIKPVTIFLL